MEGSNEIIGYYTLSNLSVDLSSFPPERAKKLGRYPTIPSILIGRLAASNRHGKGIGKHLLIDALYRAYELSKASGSVAVFVDSEKEAVGFYEKYGFLHVESNPLRMYIEMSQIEKLKTLAERSAQTAQPAN